MRVHLIGVCGTAMSAVACMLRDSGMEIQGSDATAYPPISTLLADKGISILAGYRAENVTPAVELVVVGNVARRDNPEVLEAQRLGIQLISMPQAIRRFFLQDRTSIVVAGTHGKTTVTSMVAWLLEHAGLAPSYMVGGIPLNFGVNYRLGRGRFFVIEGDEYDTAFFDKKAKFFHYDPSFAVLTALEYDHADIYPDLAALEKTFNEFAALVPAAGRIAHCREYPALAEVVRHSPAASLAYGIGEGADLAAADLVFGPEGTEFQLLDAGRPVARVKTRLAGRHNVLNALAAASAAAWAGVPLDKVVEGLALFEGVARRFQVVARERGITVVDDFAHHPTAVRETLAAARTRFPDARIFAAFHFESNTSRRKVFEKEYSKAFADADYVFLTYPLKKGDNLQPEDYLDPKAVLAGIRKHAQGAFAFEEMRAMAAHMAGLLRPGDVVVAMSGRDFTPFHTALVEMLRHQPG